jgi:hypothetical protein
MEVEGIHLASADTEEGHAVHRKVDHASAAPKDDGYSVARSLNLSSSALGVTAVLDIAEIQDRVAIPVEYRKGKPNYRPLFRPPDEMDLTDEPPLPEASPWPTD